MYFMPDALVSISWLLPDYSICGPFICFRVPNYVFSTILSGFLINLLLAICILRYALLLDVLIDICFLLCI